MPKASSTRTSASVPFATPTVSRTPRYAAASRSNAATFGPRMKSELSSTPSIAARMRGSSGSYCAFTSTSGIGRTAGESRGPQATVDPKRQQDQDCGDNGVLEVAEVVVEALVAASRGPADPGECERPNRRADGREQCVPRERRLEHSRRDGDERANDGSNTANEGGEVLPALERA